MFADIVLPGDEQELARMAKRLGTQKLLLLYPFGNVPSLPKLPVRTDVAVLCTPSQIPKALKQHMTVAVRSSDNDRQVFERKQVPHLLLNLGESGRKDRIHQRESGVSQPLLRDLRKHKTKVILSVDSLLNVSGEQRARLLGRWMQNIALCRKMNVQIIIASLASGAYGLRAAHDRQSIGVVLGMHEKEAKEAVSQF